MAIPLMAIMGGMMGGMGMANMFPPLTRWGQHGLNRGWRNEILQPPEAIEAFYRRLVDSDFLDHELASLGYSKERVDHLLKIRQQMIGVIESIILWRRQEISDQDLEERLSKLGLPENDIPLWVKFTETRPGVQDIIRFAVREVYSPEIAEKYGQFEGADEIAAVASDDLKAVGIRPEDLRNYWAAHWELPSVQQGYEMVQRNVIGLDDLRTLMRTADVMPYWREKLIAISYNPLTRVDVRRMHKVGTLTDADLIRAYQDVGYNPDNAQRMADFTILYNGDPNASEMTGTDKERDLTKTDIIKGLADGLFSPQEAGDALMMLGYSQEEIDYYFARVAFDQDKTTVNTLIKLYRTAYIGNTMTHNEIVDAFNQYNVSSQRIENLFNIWDIEKAIRTQRPTKAEILSFLRKGIIKEDVAVTELSGMGYAQKYIDMYLQTVS